MSTIAQNRDFTLSAPLPLQNTGFLQHLLPRFSLKFGMRITLVATDVADATLGAEGVAVFAGPDQVWHLSHQGGEGPIRFQDWLLSDIGQRTIESFTLDGAAPFTIEMSAAPTLPVKVPTGDIAAGESLSLAHCGRCHVINDSNRMKGMGATPSFALMRTFADWQRRFTVFYALNPHPSFTQVAGISLPFDPERPPPIVPVKITQDELDAILAYVATISPADLGAPLQSQ